MPNFTDLTGLASAASAATASMLLLPGIARLSRARRILLLGAVFVLMLIPFAEMPFAAYVRGAAGDLSITTLVLLWCALLKPWCNCVTVEVRSRLALLGMIALGALALYPLALGAGIPDPYRLGYDDPKFIAALLLLGLVAWFREFSLITLCVALAMLAWTIGWYESDNLWDYLLDPFVSVYALVAIIIRMSKAVLKLQRNRSC